MMHHRYVCYRLGKMQYARPMQRAIGSGRMVIYYEEENVI